MRTDVTTTVHEPLTFGVIGTDLGFPEGPVIDDDGSVLVVDVVATPWGGPNGMALARGDTVVVANNGGFLWTDVNGVRIPIDRATHTNEPPGFTGGWIERVDLASGKVDVRHREHGGHPLRGPNDLVFDEAGGLWFTDHGKGRLASVDRGGLYYAPADGGPLRQVAFPLLGPNGVGLARPPLGLGPGRPRRGPPSNGIAGRPPRRRLSRRHPLLARLPRRRGGRPHRHWRHRRRHRRRHPRRRRDRRPPHPRRRHHQHRLRRDRRPPGGHHAVPLRPPRRDHLAPPGPETQHRLSPRARTSPGRARGSPR